MTANELGAKFNDEFGIDKPWPKSYEVDHETYANACQAVFDNKIRREAFDRVADQFLTLYSLSVGIHGGIMFKNVELILVNK